MPAVPTPPTIRDGVTPSSTWNQFRDAINFLLNPPIAKLRQATVQSIPNGTITPIIFDVEDVDTDPAGLGGHSTSVDTSRWIAQYAGWYSVAGRVAYSAASTGTRMSSLAVNGTEVAASRIFIEASAADLLPMSTSLVYLTQNDYVEVYAYHTQGTALNTEVGTTDSQSALNIWWVSR